MLLSGVKENAIDSHRDHDAGRASDFCCRILYRKYQTDFEPALR